MQRSEWAALFVLRFGESQMWTVGLVEGESEFYDMMAKDLGESVYESIRSLGWYLTENRKARLGKGVETHVSESSD